MTMPNIPTGTSSRTVTVELDGSFSTSEPAPLCEDCKTPMHPMVWLCGRCGSVE